jgi:predicted RNA binding protein YcfA (HicA-like mRNA interferase family)
MKIVKDDGWVLDRVKGSHYHFHHSLKIGIVTIPHPKKDMSIKTANSILKQAGIRS